MTQDDEPNKLTETQEAAKAFKSLGQIITKIMFDIVVFLAVAILVSLAWNFYIVDIFKDFVILPQVTPIQVAALKLVLNHINPFK